MEQVQNPFPRLGERLPTLEVNTTQGPMVLPDAVEGKWMVLFSHPADFTPVCTTEFVAFQKRADQFAELNTQLVGLSIDQVFSHIKWVDWIEEKLGVTITFPVIADDQGVAAKKLAMVHEGKGTNTVRAVFIVDPQGVLRAMLYYPQELGRNMDEIVRMIKALQVSEGNGCAMPANWPNNELIKDRVIVPPAACVKDAHERLEKYDGFDWWFCHRDLK